LLGQQKQHSKNHPRIQRILEDIAAKFHLSLGNKPNKGEKKSFCNEASNSNLNSVLVLVAEHAKFLERCLSILHQLVALFVLKSQTYARHNKHQTF
jgi:hypothetical protein